MAKKKLYDLPQEVAGVVKNTIKQPRDPAPSAPKFPEGAPVIPKPKITPTSDNPTKPVNDNQYSANDSPQILYNSEKNIPTGIILPNGRQYLSISPKEVRFLANKYAGIGPDFNMAPPPAPATQEQQIQAEIDRAKLKKQMEADQTPPNVSQEQLNTLGQLTPEQKAEIANIPIGKKSPDIKQVLSIAGERASVGAASGATGGALAGVLGGPAAPLSIPAAAILGGAGGAIVGGVSGAWSAFTEASVENVDSIDINVASAIDNINKAPTLANRGASYAEVNQKLTESIAALNLAERQYKEASKDLFQYKTHAKKKLEQIISYRENMLQDQIILTKLALQKPDPRGIDSSLNTGGGLIG